MPADTQELTPDVAFAILRSAANHSSEYERAENFLLDGNFLVECGSCGCYHPRLKRHIMPDERFNGGYGDCRDDKNRF